MRRQLFLTAVLALAAAPAHAQDTAAPARPPVARIVPRADTTLGDVRIDNYFWLRDDRRQDTAVINYLEAENRYAQEMMRHTEPLQERLFQEMKGRIKETDLSVPERIGAYYYYSRTEAGKQYPIHARKRGSLTAPEEVLLDVNQLAEGKRYFSLGAQEVSPDGRLLAFATDTSGAERYTLMVKELATGRILPDRVGNVNGNVEWAADNRTLFYGVSDAANRPHRVMRHVLGSTAADAVVGEENDDLYRIGVGRTKDRRFLLLNTSSFDASEVRYLAADRPMEAFRVIRPKTANVLYDVEHHGNRFLITTNEGAPNFKLVWAPDTDPRRENWRDLVAASDSVLLDGIDVFRDYLVLYQRANAVRKIRVVPFAGGRAYDVDFPEPIYTYRGARNADFESRVLRFTYTSMVTPASVYDFDMANRTRELKKATEVPGYDPTLYASERTWARATDGTLVPISLVYRKPFVRDGSRPMLLYAYGSYGASTDPGFSSANLSLLDRGVVYAIAHIRGGQEMGRQWYDQGKLLNKKNTFTDFIAAAEHLVRENYTTKDKLVISGGSAGGLLMGAVVNMRPDLFKLVLSYVPFVDVINTMYDASLPLTAQEWLEWGNPNNKDEYAYMKSYSPYDNIAAKEYPTMLVRTSLNDSQVMYWEPAKYVAKLRTLKTDSRPLLFKINLDVGHGGASGRFDSLHEIAEDTAFLLVQLGLAE
ncbi:MAG TPA: S9 family peptidase [Longimicrobium sp.]|nr:S9 family peptidase [Longimicrobium sp.]